MLKTLLLALLLLLAHPALAAEGLHVIRDAEIETGLKTMCTPIFEQAGVSPAVVRFVLIEDGDLNAFVAGGQNIFLTTALIEKTKNPEELTGVVAHETGHIALGHLFRSQEVMGNASFQTILSGVLGIAAGIASRSGEAGMAVARAGAGMSLNNLLSHSRTQEASADQAGTRFLGGAGMPVTGFLSFMEQLKNQELLPETAQSEYVRTHPLTQDRIAFLQNTADARAKAGRPGSLPPSFRELHGRMKAKLLGYLQPDRALLDRSDTADAKYARAIAWYRKGQTDRALQELEELLKAEPDNPYLFELKGQVLFEAGRGDDSLSAYARAVTLAPGEGLIRIAYGHALLESRRDPKKSLPEAVRQLELSLHDETHSPEAHYFLAMAYGKMGEEGLSRLHLANEYVMENRPELAKREANLAVKSLPPHSPALLQARDILAVTDKKKDDKEGESPKTP